MPHARTDTPGREGLAQRGVCQHLQAASAGWMPCQGWTRYHAWFCERICCHVHGGHVPAHVLIRFCSQLLPGSLPVDL